MNKRIYIEGDGCSRRLLEQAKLRCYLAENNYEIVNSPSKAEMILVSTCAFNKKEEDQSVRRLRNLKRYGAEILVYGCLPDIAPTRYGEFSDIKHLAPKDLDKVDSFFEGIRIKFDDIPEMHSKNAPISRQRLVSLLRQKLLTKDVFTRDFYSRCWSRAKVKVNCLMRSKTEYNLMVSRGCMGRCTYCAIRFSIGKVKSKPLETVLSEFREGVGRGYRQIIIVGDDPGCYGQERESDFPTLLGRLADEAERLTPPAGGGSPIRFHIRDVHPKWLVRYQDRLLEILKREEFSSFMCPLQSGSNRILNLMEREHDAGSYVRAHQRLKAANSQMKLYSQLIMGFPSETEQDFLDSLDVVRACHFDHVHVFQYHEKENRAAGSMPEKVPEKVALERMKRSRRLLGRDGIKVYFHCPV